MGAGAVGHGWVGANIGLVTTKLAHAPTVEVLRLAHVTAVPESHPEHAGFRPFPVHAFLIRHPDGPIVVDTGIGFGNAFIDELYPHEAWHLVDELHRCGIDERDVRMIVNSHLHFDHCGQNHSLPCPIAVQRAEIVAATERHYTVPDWAAIPPERALIVDGDTDLAVGVTVLLTPGHTPGHQAVVVRSNDSTVLIAAQCIFRRRAWSERPEPSNLHDPSWQNAADDSLQRLRALKPHRVLLAHDAPLEAADITAP